MLVKTQHVLFIFDELTNGKKIRSREIIDQFGITPRTFARYISEINCYFFNFFKYKEVKYDRSEKVYYLTDLYCYIIIFRHKDTLCLYAFL